MQTDPLSCCPPQTLYGNVHGRDGVIKLRSRLVVPGAPRLAAVHRDQRALIGDEKNDVGMVRINPQVLIIVAARCAPNTFPGPAAV